MTSFTAYTPSYEKSAAQKAPSRARMVARPGVGVNSGPGYHLPLCAGESSGILVDPGGGDPDPPRPRADGGRQRPGFPPPGAAVRGWAGLLGDGLLRGARAPQRADAGLPPGGG